MKRIIAFTITLLLLFSMSIAAHADLDEGDFNNWYVRCGPSGYSFVDRPYFDTPEGADLHDYLKPGTRLWVHSFDRETKKYLLSIDDDNHKIKGIGHLYVTEAELNKYFVGEKQSVRKDFGEKLKKQVKCVVTPRVGLILRQGPDRSYPSYRTIPYNTRLTYQYVYKTDTYNWGYVTYRGQAGWCCIDYTREEVPAKAAVTETTVKPVAETTAKAPTETTAKATTEPSTVPVADATTAATTAPTTAAATTKPTTEPTSEPSTAPVEPAEQEEPVAEIEETKAEEKPDFFTSTITVIIVCCTGAFILSLTAIVILLIIKRRK